MQEVLGFLNQEERESVIGTVYQRAENQFQYEKEDSNQSIESDDSEEEDEKNDLSPKFKGGTQQTAEEVEEKLGQKKEEFIKQTTNINDTMDMS